MFIHPTLLADASGQILEEITEQVTAKPEKILQGTEKMDGTQIAAMTIVGLAVVFSALLILVIFLYLSGGIFKSAGKQKKSAPEKAAPAKPAPAAKPAAGEARPTPRPAPRRVNPDTHVPRRTTGTPSTYDSYSTFVERRPARRGMTPDKPSFMKKNREEDFDD